MCILQLMMPAESAHDTIAALGEVGLLQFKDLNSDKSAFQRTFANQVRCVFTRKFLPLELSVCEFCTRWELALSISSCSQYLRGDCLCPTVRCHVSSSCDVPSQ